MTQLGLCAAARMLSRESPAGAIGASALDRVARHAATRSCSARVVVGALSKGGACEERLSARCARVCMFGCRSQGWSSDLHWWKPLGDDGFEGLSRGPDEVAAGLRVFPSGLVGGSGQF